MSNPPGRPSTFSTAVGDEIVARLSKGEPLAVICRDDHMPAVRTVSDWKEAHPAFAADFARARDEGFDALASQCLEIADDSSGDAGGEPDETLEDQAHGGALKRSQRSGAVENVQRAKLRIETRLKLLAKWDPKRYGDRMAVEASGPNGGPIETHTLTSQLGSLPKDKRDAVREAIKAALG